MGFCGFTFGCGCGDIYDFFGPPHGHALENSSADAVAGYVLTRVASLCDLTAQETQSSSSGKWEADCTDFGSTHNTVWLSRAQHVAADKSHIVYYFLSEDSTDDFTDNDTVWHVVKVSAPFNGSPTVLAEYSFDWDSITRDLLANPYWLVLDADHNRLITQQLTSGTLAVRPGSPLYASDTRYSSAGYRTAFQPDGVIRPVLAGLSLADGSYTSYHPAAFDSGSGETANLAREAALADNYLPYYVAIHDPSVGVASKYELSYTPGGYGIPGIGTHPTLDNWEQTVVVGTVNYAGTPATVVPGITVYNHSGATELPGGTASDTLYEVPHVRCDFLESFEGTHLGIFYYALVTMTARSFPTGLSSQGLCNYPGGASWDLDLNAGEQPTRADILMPSGTLWTGVATQTATGSGGAYRWDADDDFVPICGRLALGSDGLPNGKYFLLTANWYGDLFAEHTICRLHYMDEDTILWTHDFSDFTTDPQLTPDLTVTDRFCYVQLIDGDDANPDTNRHSYAFDYDGNRYRLYLDIGHEDGPYPAIHLEQNRTYQGDWGDASEEPVPLNNTYLETWASVKYSDQLSPTRNLMGRYQ